MSYICVILFNYGGTWILLPVAFSGVGATGRNCGCILIVDEEHGLQRLLIFNVRDTIKRWTGVPARGEGAFFSIIQCSWGTTERLTPLNLSLSWRMWRGSGPPLQEYIQKPGTRCSQEGAGVSPPPCGTPAHEYYSLLNRLVSQPWTHIMNFTIFEMVYNKTKRYKCIHSIYIYNTHRYMHR